MFSREEAPPEVEAAIAQTVQAYASLSKDKVGALMVFERKVSLDDIIKTGTPLNSTVNAELLKNLFWNKAPLHDGAVIVRNGHIVGAGCVLPLSGNINLSKDLGMRHRAGIGMSENSDAVVAIVSEETGSISAQAASGAGNLGTAPPQRAAAPGGGSQGRRQAVFALQVEKRWQKRWGRNSRKIKPLI